MVTPIMYAKTYKRRIYAKAAKVRRILRAAAYRRTKAAEPTCGSGPRSDVDDVSTAAPSSPTPSVTSSSSPGPSQGAAAASPSPRPALIAEAEARAPEAAEVNTAAPARDAEATAAIVETPDAIVAVASKPSRQRQRAQLLPSVFEGRAPVLFFSYTEACLAKQRCTARAVPLAAGTPELYFSHGKNVSEYNALLNTMKQGGLKKSDPDEDRWTVLWARHPSPELLRTMSPWQRTNHFPGSVCLGDKGLLWKCIEEMQRRYRNDFNITPAGYLLPENLDALEAKRADEPTALWIWKPTNGSCGRGIQVFASGDQSMSRRKLMRKSAIVQQYVPSPLLVHGFKFDMRIYVVVLSYEPLKVFINTDGLVRLATQKYSEDPATLSDTTRHLTNYSLNKKSPTFVQNKDDAPQGQGEEGVVSSKWSLSDLKAHFETRGLDYDYMFKGIEDVVIKTLLAAEPHLRKEWAESVGGSEDEGWSAQGAAGARSKSCFELYGFDVLVDSALRAWLLEVNIYPSMSSGSPLDKRIKTKLLADTLTLVGVSNPTIPRGGRGGVKRPRSDTAGASLDGAGADGGEAAAPRRSGTDAAEAAKAARLARCKHAHDAVSLFDENAWEIVLDATDEDYRRGGFERIFPARSSAKYLPFMGEETFANVVLRRWYEAGGSEAFFGVSAKYAHLVPSYVPQQISFRAT